MGSSGGPAQVIPFNAAELAPSMPSVFNGPFNVKGALQNSQMLQAKYPWITPPAGAFAGALPGQFANSGGNIGVGTPSSVGVTNPNPPPPTPQQIQQFGPTQNPSTQPPVDLQALLSVLNKGTPSPTGP